MDRERRHSSIAKKQQLKSTSSTEIFNGVYQIKVAFGAVSLFLMDRIQ